MSKIGQISQGSNCEVKYQVELTWKIESIFAYTVEDVCYESPHFSVQDSEWFFRIYPNGDADTNSVGWISLYLVMRHGGKTSAKCAIYSFGVKIACGAVVRMGKDLSWVFGEDDIGFGRTRFLYRSELLRRKSELTSSGALTLTCSLSVMDDTFGSTTFKLDTLQKNFAELFISRRGCDVTLKVQHREFPVHKTVLSARSTIFAAMFEVEMKEKESGFVEIVDCDPDAFQDFLTFLYSAEFLTDSNKVIDLYKIADKYCVLELRSFCALYMMRHLTVENVCDVIVLGDQFGDEALEYKSKDFFNNNFGNIIRTTSWKSLLESNSRLVNELLIDMATEYNLYAVNLMQS